MSSPATAVYSSSAEGMVFREVRFDNARVLLQIATPALATLEIIVRNGIKAIRHHGLEVGGVVIGRMPRPPESIITLLDFVPIEIEYRFGPRFRASERDRKLFGELLSSYPHPDFQVIGYFRSQVEKSVQVRQHDHELLRRLFGARTCCMFLVQLGMFDRSMAHFYMKSGDSDPRMLGQFPLVDIPAVSPVHELPRAWPEPDEFEAETPEPEAEQSDEFVVDPQISEAEPVTTLEAPATKLVPAQMAPLTSAPLVQVPESASRAPEEKSHGAGRRKLILAGAVAALIAAVAAVAIGGLWRSAPLGLTLEARGSAAVLRWDTSTALARNAVSGSLMIGADDADADRVQLNRAQVRSGSYTFTPRGSDVSIRLILNKSDDTFAGETRRFHLGAASQAATQANGSLSGPPDHGYNSDLQMTVHVSAADAAADEPADEPAGAAPGVAARVPEPEPARSAPTVRQFKLPAQAAAQPGTVQPNTVQQIDSPPEIPTSRVLAQATGSAAQFISAPQIQPPPEVPKTVPQVPVTGSAPPLAAAQPSEPPAEIQKARPQVPSTGSTPPLRSPARPSAFTAAVPTVEIKPIVPSVARSMIDQEVSIKIALSVDRGGRVTNVSPVGEYTGIGKVLTRYALQAAKSWRFNPARRDGQAVDSETEIVFRFPKR